MPRRVRGFSVGRRTSRRVTASVWSHEGSRTAGFADDRASASWLAVTGNPGRDDLRERAGDELLQLLLDECLSNGPAALDSLSPPFAAVFHDGRAETTHVRVDRCGIQHLYFAQVDGECWISTSCLALVSVVRGELDLDGLAEWLAVGHFLTDRTMLSGVRKLGPGEGVALGRYGAEHLPGWRPSADFPPEAVDERAFLDRFLASLEAVASSRALSAEVTGGLDSRLVLAGLLSLQASFLGWTLGPPESAELRTVARLEEAVPFEHLDVLPGADLGERMPDLVRSMHELSDGEVNALEYAPLLIAFEALDGRRTTSISGTGGETARGFYFRVLKSKSELCRRVPLGALARRISAATGAIRQAARRELVPDPDASLAALLRRFVEASPAQTPEGILEDFYLRARMQRFAGRNITTTGLFCQQALPYFDNRLVDLVLKLPAEFKRDGRIVRRALEDLSPSLAAIPLDSGSPVAAPSLRRPDVGLQRAVALGRKGLRRYGRSIGRTIAGTPPGTVPWDLLASHAEFRAFVEDTLVTNDARVGMVLERDRVRGIVCGGLSSGNLYPVGLLLTLEFTLRALGRGTAG